MKIPQLPFLIYFYLQNLTARIYIDLNVGMNRTGIRPENAIALFETLNSTSCIVCFRSHAYDGHIKDRT